MVAVFTENEERLTLGRLCSRAGVNISTGHRWRLAGKLDAFRIGGRWFVSRESWEQFIEKCNGGGSNTTRPGDEGTRGRTLAQRRRDDARAAARCEALGV